MTQEENQSIAQQQWWQMKQGGGWRIGQDGRRGPLRGVIGERCLAIAEPKATAAAKRQKSQSFKSRCLSIIKGLSRTIIVQKYLYYNRLTKYQICLQAREKWNCFPNFCKVSFLLPDILARAGHVAFYVDRRLSAHEETASQHGHFSSHYFQRLRFNNLQSFASFEIRTFQSLDYIIEYCIIEV